MIRRSITVEDSLNNYINTFRARMLEHKGEEIDFTRAINALAALGARHLSKKDSKLPNDELELFNEYLGLEDLQVQGAHDSYVDQWLKHEFPKITSKSSESNDEDEDSTERKKGSDDQSE